MQYKHIFGPVPSRRFGRSLGVDLLPPGDKVCTYNCVFCQLGDRLSMCENPDFPAANEIIRELSCWLGEHGDNAADFITLSGNGEPTLHPEFGKILDWCRENTKIPTLLLSNGSLLFKPDIREQALRADNVKISLHSAASSRHFAITRPKIEIDFETLIEGVKTFRAEFKGKLILEVFLIPTVNDSEEEIAALKRLAADFSPDSIDFNSERKEWNTDAIKLMSEEERAALLARHPLPRKKMLINEIFYSLQGEGFFAGMPSAFVRFAGCNLACAWCDTPDAVNPKSMTPREIFGAIENFKTSHCVITGGEPLLQAELADFTQLLKENGRNISIETNCTIAPPKNLVCDLATLSPKQSGFAHVAREWQKLAKEICLKIVCAGRNDEARVLEMIAEVENCLPREKIFLMPLTLPGCDFRKEVTEICLEHGFRFSPRLHIDLAIK